MSRTSKDSRRQRDTVIEIVKVGVDSFDLLLNHELYRSSAPKAALPEWLCVRYGFCGDEYESILQTVECEGRKTIVL